jgi:hypothetical protein
LAGQTGKAFRLQQRQGVVDDKKELVPGLEITATTPSLWAINMEGMLRWRLPELLMRMLCVDTQDTMERKDTSQSIILY